MKTWDELLKNEYEKPYYKELMKFINDEYKNKRIYPSYEDIFKCFKYTPYDKVKVLLLGQDPYHNEHEAHGLSFSVKEGITVPVSLRNIYKELNSDLGIDNSKNGCLIPWAKEGVLLLNSVLTVEENKPTSHKDKGWEIFTDNVIRLVNDKDTPVVFILLGNYAKKKEALITNPKHLVLTSSHPSFFSCNKGFFGSKIFSKTNEFLVKNGIQSIDFKI